MLRKRKASRDDGFIHRLIGELLLPYTRKTMPGASFSRPKMRERLKNCITYVYSTGSRKPAGFISLRQMKELLFVDLLAVDPRQQGRGIGSLLLEAADRHARRHGCREIRLWVDEANDKARQFYGSKGFVPVYFEKTIRCYLMLKPV